MPGIHEPHFWNLLITLALITLMILVFAGYFLRRQKNERKQAQEQLRAGEERLQEIIDLMPLALFVKDANSRITLMNRTCEEQWGSKSGEVLGSNASHIFPSDQMAMFIEKDREVFANRQFIEFEEPVWNARLRQNRIARTCKKPVYDKNGNPAYLICLSADITEHKQAEEFLLLSQKLEAVGVLAAGMSHDYNNILTTVVGYIELAKQELDSDSDVCHYLEMCEASSAQAIKLGQQLQAIAHCGDVELQTISLAPLLTFAVNESLRDSPVIREYDLAETLPPVTACVSQIHQIFTQLTVNAREAMPGGGVLRISARACNLTPVGALPLPAGDYLQISFQDTGSGILPENLPRIHDPYFTTKAMGNQKGQGLGLALCQAIIRRHRGLITAESEAGRGATFHIWLPIALNGGSGQKKAAAP
jgi:PAS domain S-box-containing protein